MFFWSFALCCVPLDTIFHWISVRYLQIIDSDTTDALDFQQRPFLSGTCKVRFFAFDFLEHSSNRGTWELQSLVSVFCAFRFPFYHDISMALFNSFLSTRVGEASHPGPASSHGSTSDMLSLTVLNPTALYGKTAEVLRIGSDCFLCSETSATSIAQTKISHDFRNMGYRCFWSCPVGNKKDTIDNRPSLRGEASGSAIICNLPSRNYRNPVLPALWNTCRVSTAVVQLRGMEVLIISVYGFTASRTHESYRANDTFFAYIYELAVQAKMPFIIGGDFNTQISTLPCFQLFRQLGVVEAFHLNMCKFGFQLPPTCNGVTRNDTYLLHPLLAQRVVEFKVQTEHIFEPHVPITAIFDLSFKLQKPLKWDLPKSWIEFAPSAENIESAYIFTRNHVDLNCCSDNSQDIETLFVQWSKAVEQAVDLALQWQHRLDPVTNPVSSLPSSHRGRCVPRKLIQPKQDVTPKGDRFGGYNPQCEIFSLRCRHKVRQTRRIASLLKAVKSAITNHGPLHSSHPCWSQIRSEWSAILNAPGYGNAWYKWILSFEPVTYISQCPPSLEDLDVIYQITKFDADAACQQEHSIRARKFKYHIQLDNSQGFAKTTYKIMKNSTAHSLDELPYQIAMEASLCRNKKVHSDDLQKLLLDHDCDFLTQQNAFFGQAEISIHKQVGRAIFFKVVDGVIPAKALLTQDRIAATPHDIFPLFSKFWSPMWLRDSAEEVTNEELWNNFETELQSCEFPFMDISLDLSSVSVWKNAIRKLKMGKAVGVCGWSYEEFRKLPDMALEDLAMICSKCWNCGLPASMMQARVALLAKVDHPTSMNHGRPITIMSCIYRLISKIVYDQVAPQWSKHLPLAISGGLPGRGVRDLALNQSITIEKAISNKVALCGTSIDLTKAFNLIPRLPAAMVLRKLGIPQWFIRFWMANLANLVRVPVVRGHFGPSVASSTGVPEGDCISVLVMLALNSIFFYRLQNPQLRPFCYADNWSWLAYDTRESFRAFVKVLNLTSSCKMIVDLHKSWLWATDPSMRKAITSVNALFPGQSVEISVKSYAKDLGEIVQYSKTRFASPMIERVKEACKRLDKLKWLPLPLECKVLRINAAVWSLALYGADLHYLGMNHFHKLRQAASACLTGSHQQTNPWITFLVVSKRLDDPLLHAFISACRCVRRLARVNSTDASDFIQTVRAFTGDVPFGPASSFAKYLGHLGLVIHDSGEVYSEHWNLFNLLLDSSKYIAKQLRLWWPSFVFGHIGHRKGLEHGLFDFRLTKDVFCSFSDQDKKILLLNLVGGYQSGMHKNQWTSDDATPCELCGSPDDRQHRFLHCPKFQDIRDRHRKAIIILSHARPGWLYHPFAWQFPHFDLIREFFHSVSRSPIPTDDRDYAPDMVFFTDGGCADPTNCVLRKSSWSVVVDRFGSQIDRMQGSDFFLHTGNKHPCLEVLATGITPGPQSASRGELFALLQATRFATNVEQCDNASFVVDAQYVINVIRTIENNEVFLDKVSNSDLVCELKRIWNPEKFHIEKIKSHLDPFQAEDFYSMWRILGNSYADKAATAAMDAIPSEIKQILQEAQAFVAQEKQNLLVVLEYFVELNRARAAFLEASKKTSSDCTSSSADNIIETLRNYRCVNPERFLQGDLDPELAAAHLQGSTFAFAIWEWAKCLKWPSNDADNSSSDLGVSWLELLMNFYLTTKMLPPIRVEGLGATSRYLDYFHHDVIILPASKRSFGSLSFTFQAAIRGFTSLVDQPLWPSKHAKFVSSIAKMGFKGKQSGLVTRPDMPNAALTIHYLQQYILSIGEAKSAHLPLQRLEGGETIDFPRPDEISAEDRYKNYMKLVKRRRRSG